MKNTNNEISQCFNEIADLMAILNENSFKIRAYREAARRLKEEFEPITKKTGKKELMKMPGIGDTLADKIIQYLKNGKIRYLEQLRKKIPKPVRDLLKVPHLGPNRVRDLYLNLDIQSKDDLKKYAKSGEIAKLNGFGDKLVKQILGALETGQKKKKRHERSEVKPIADKLVRLLEKIKGVKKAAVAGSYRRKARTVGDLDILVVGSKKAAEKAVEQVEKSFKDLTFLAKGETKVAFVIFPENLQVDIRLVPQESYGAALLYFTGNKDYNVMMRKAAIEKGYLLNEYGLFKDGEYIAGRTEKEVFEKLGMKYAKPEMRK